MSPTLPPKLSAKQFDVALAAFAKVVGSEWVFSSEQDRHAYGDPYEIGERSAHAPSAAVAPANVEEVQAIVRLANVHHTPLWPITRGKNMGYGGAAPRMAGSVVLDLGRMKRIIEVDPKTGYCLIEPGVGFFDLHDYLRTNNIPLWMSVPGNAWGSVMGNALEHGNGTMGDHSANLCGMEVVLPEGELLRTGMGAMRGNKTWSLWKYGFGPSWDQTFMQSNFGVVTKAAMWLMPEPPASMRLSMNVPNADDIGWLVDVLTPLRIGGVIDQSFGIGSYGRVALTSQRSEWFEGKGKMPDEVVRRIVEQFGGWWNFSIRLYGHESVIEAKAAVIEAAFAAHTKQRFTISRWKRGEPYEQSGAGIPGVGPLHIVNWHGGRGGHIGYSPILPANGALAVKQLHKTLERFAQFDLDYYGTYYINGRTVQNINLILFNRDDPQMVKNVRGLFAALIEDAKKDGYAEYRTHIDYMDAVADTFDFNNHIQRRFNEKVKDAIDPNGIIAPGKSGIWPRNYRTRK